ncbi:TPA: hypothetical protein ACXDAZ_002698 [Clostridium botulinum]|uniref:hypothetical protein n=1 Tax=Clostridium botulinum TaxID=1491 RepID=UPI00174885D1|nr:hypothetical protein [Clostridium botulinum]MBD5589146.1 hypothetical protein [Clostridium botulinum]
MGKKKKSSKKNKVNKWLLVINGVITIDHYLDKIIVILDKSIILLDKFTSLFH